MQVILFLQSGTVVGRLRTMEQQSYARAPKCRGFTPEEADLYYLYKTFACENTNATREDMHPLFQQAQWLNLSSKNYQRLIPALIVVTQLTRQACSLSFHNHILHGELKYLVEKRKYYLASLAYETLKFAHLMTTETLDITLPKYLRLEFDELGEDGRQYDARTWFGTSVNASEAIYRPRVKLDTHHFYALHHVVNYGSSLRSRGDLPEDRYHYLPRSRPRYLVSSQ